MIKINGSYYSNPTFPTINDNIETTPPGNINYFSTAENEQSYIENILRLNKGKKVKAYVSFPESSAWQNKIFEGTIEQAGRDHLIIKSITDGSWFLIRMIYLDYVEFDEKINYII